LLRCELAGVDHAPDEPAEDRGDDEDRDDADHAVARDRLGPGDVVEDGAHRYTFQRFSRVRCSQLRRRTMATKKAAIQRRTTMAVSPRSERFARIEPSSTTEKPAAIVVFFSSAMSTLIMGGTIERNACGRTMSVIT